MRTMLKILLLTSLTSACLAKQKTHPDNPHQPHEPYRERVKVFFSFHHEQFGSYVLMFTNIAFVAVVRHFGKVYEISVPYSVLTVLMGLLLGIGSLYSTWVKSLVSIARDLIHLEITLYLPAIAFGTAFCIDVHAFLKSLPQILIISIPVSFLSALIAGYLMRLVIDNSWPVVDGVVFGILFCAVYPFDILRWLKETGNNTKYITVLLEGETIIAAVFSVYIYLLMTLHIQGLIVQWYQFVMSLVRLIIFGVPASYMMGHLSCCLFRLSYNNQLQLALVTIVACYSNYYFLASVANTGLLATMICGVMLGIERTSLPGDTEKFITDMWKAITLVLNASIFLITGMIAPQMLSSHTTLKEYFLVIVSYLVINIARFVSFLVFCPILSRIGYGMTFHNMVICVWGGLKNPISLSLATNLSDGTYPKEKAGVFFLHSVAVYLLMLVINATFFRIVLKVLGLSELSVSRQVNMNNCMQYVLQARERTIAILKMDRFLSDANWPLVNSVTNLKHPYKRKMTNYAKESDSEDENEDYFLGYKFTVCPDCKKSILNEPSAKEMKEMSKEAKLRVLKLRKIFYSRRYQNGLLTKEGVRIAHQSVEVAMDTEEKQIEVDGLIKMFSKENEFFKFIRTRFMYFLQSKDETKPPRKLYRLICHRIMIHIAFQLFMNLAYVCNLIIVIYHLITTPPIASGSFLTIFSCNCVLLLIYITEFWIKIFGYSWIHIYEHGFQKYFKLILEDINFIVLCATFFDVILNMFVIIYPKTFGLSLYYWYPWYILQGIKFLRILCFFQLLSYFKGIYPTIVKFLDTKIDKNRMLAYELGNNYISTEEEVLENISNVVDNDKIRDVMKQKIDIDRLVVNEVYGASQKDIPWVAITVKTKLAIGAVLNSLRENIQELKLSGWMDDLEYSKLSKSLIETYRNASTIHSVQPSTTKSIFKEISWMGDDDVIINYLYDNVTTKKFDPGDVICDEGESIEGVYVLISGLFHLNYIVRKNVIDKLSEAGTLPIVDYLSCTRYEENSMNYIISGNCIGELSVLTERPYNCTITAVQHSQVFVLRREIIKQAMEMDSDPINGLESRIWKSVSFKIAVSIMMNITTYRSLTMQKIQFAAERAFVPNISNIKIFVVNEMMEDIILVEGVAVDLNTRDVYTGPCHVPRSVQRLVMPKSSTLNMELEIETKLMIIPAKDFDEYDIMVNEEQTCEMVSESSTKCLKHLVQDKSAKRKAAGKHRKRVTTKGNKSDLSLSKSRITFATSEGGLITNNAKN